MAEVSPVDEVDYSLEEAYFSTIASGHLEAVRKAPGVISVISSSDMEAMGATHLDEVLEAVSGLHVVRSDLNRLEPVYSIRGIHSGFSAQVLVLFNGMELKNPFNGGLPSAFRLPLNAIERIEVIKGASSALYGADAYSGVINIVPKRVRDYAPAIAQMRLGSFDSRDFTVQYQHQDALGAGYFFSLEHQESGGDPSRTLSQDLQTLNDLAYGTSASLAPGELNTNYSVTNMMLNVENDTWSWNNWYWSNLDAGTGQGVARALDKDGFVDSTSFISHLQYRSIVDHGLSVESNLKYHFSDADSLFKLFPDNSRLPIGSDGNPFTAPGNLVTFTNGVIGSPAYKAHKGYFDTSFQFIGLENHIVRVQLGGQYVALRTGERKNYGPGVLDGSETVVDGSLTDVSDQSEVFLADQERHNVFVALQDQWDIQDYWTLTLGGRLDQYSDFGRVFNPRMGLVWEPGHNFTGKLLYGEAFRAPSFSELYLKNNPSGLGSETLKPERIKTYELVADYQAAPSLRLINTLYFYKAEDLIANRLVGSVFQFQNAVQQEGYGFEVESHWRANDALNLKAQYSYQHSENSDTGEAVADVPNHTAYLAVDYRLSDQWRLHLNNHWIGSSFRASGDSRDKLSGYSWTTLKLTKAFEPEGLSVALIVKNLLDENARAPASSIIPNDYPLEGRSIWGELTYHF
ncbi:TonB-dependent receptor plug domain-containing protein [Pontibacterium sp.]|uniref:TonB-dependent receptor plug domain-containing protein n=1 Tax=Pontibacterium sp. TaxID=2036026 RepID=UPI00351747A8